MISNREISRLFSLYAELLLLHQKDKGLSAVLSGASYRLRNINDPVINTPKKQLTAIFRPSIVNIIEKIKIAGTIDELDELIQLTPPGLFEMMRIKGLGGKKLALLWHVAKIDTINDLLEACRKNDLSSIPGFGAKTQQNIIKAVESYTEHKDRFHYASVADDAIKLVNELQKILKTKLISLCGEIRRMATTIASIEIIAATGTKKWDQSILRKYLVITSTTKKQVLGHTLNEIPVIIYLTTSGRFATELFERTGSANHTNKIWKKIKTKRDFKSEKEIYEKAKLPFIEPELREDLAEWNISKKTGPLITDSDIKGVVHNHTTWSDGVDSLPHFVTACKKRGYEYVVISDHSKNAHYAGGMKEEKVLRQLQEIDLLNKKLAPFHIYKSIECDILVSGELDYDKDLLKKFDLVIASIHQLLKMNEEKATARLIKAVENPFTSILGHMSGRQLLIRPGYPVNFKKVIDACAANGVVIEINANPYRLDMDWTHIPYALEKNVMIAINPDAHSIGEIDNIRWGVAAARKGGLTKNMTWNAYTKTEIDAWLKRKRRR